MSRFLFVVPPLTGHVTPLAAVAQRLTAEGHSVVWCGEPAMIWALAGRDAVVRPCPQRRFSPPQRGEGLRGYAAVRFLWESFLVPLADASADAVTETGRRCNADVVVADMQALAGPLAAARLGVPYATSATTSAPLRDSFSETPKVRSWLDGLLSGLIDRHAPDAARRITPRELELSPDLVIAFTTKALAGQAGNGSAIRYVGPAFASRSTGGPPFPWQRLDGRPMVVVTLGTVNSGVSAGFLRACAKAFELLGDRVQGVIADPLGVCAPTSDVITLRYLPLLDLLPRAAAVICHGGHNTVCEALAHGVPLVVAPIRDDQPVVAAQVVDAGAGVRLRFGLATPELVSRAVLAVLEQPAFGVAAREIQASFAGAGSATSAAEHLLSLGQR
jgi:MGT family glycosyltransferase